MGRIFAHVKFEAVAVAVGGHDFNGDFTGHFGCDGVFKAGFDVTDLGRVPADGVFDFQVDRQGPLAGNSLCPAVLLQAPGGRHIACSPAAGALLLGVGPLDLAEVEGHVVFGESAVGRGSRRADHAVGECVLHEPDFVAVGPAQVHGDAVDD